MADRAWMDKERYRASYIEGVDIFMKAAKKNTASKKTKDIKCPCVHCKNQKSWKDPSVIEQHLVTHGFVEGYTNWSHHGEIPSKQVPNQATVRDEVLSWDEDVIVVAKEEEEEEEEEVHAVEPVDDDDVVGGNGQHSTVDDADDGNVSVDDGNFADLEEMLRHAEPEDVAGSARGLDNFDALKKAANDLLYDEAKGCEKDFTLLRTVLELMRLKARNGWSDSSFNDLLVLLKKLFPQPNSLPTSTYEAKKLICPLSLGVRKIHACVNHCILFRKEYEDLDRCTTCKSSRYKTSRSQSEGLDVALDNVEESDPCKDSNKKNIPQLVMWYLPVKDRLKRLFSNPRDAELMRWHHEKRKKDGMIRHPADARQ
ncbi:uncharacterized protein LOC127757413 [Oryza glaberrima]|uniref:uncharacterized protein LOC127757413 n=1 Tax=Oryza glaberrima TaxID=4538 RepID=UPI00224C48A3|nr:uncharacterized protein LOC127757413 [Oryza glaberrima]